MIDGVDLTVHSSSTITHSAGTNVVVRTVAIEVTNGDLTINEGGTIVVSGKGYSQRNGPGAGASRGFNDAGAGAGHGGEGGNAAGRVIGSAYGSVVGPTTLGSGGGGGDGGNNNGGVVKVTVLGTTTLNGSIIAKGTTGKSGTWGAGGRIAVHYTTDT